jgi:cell division septal protein FtsQ
VFKKKKNKKTRKSVVKKEFSSAEKISQLKKVLFFILLIIFVGVTFWVLFFSSLIRVKTVKIIGFQEDFAESIVLDVLDSQYLGLLPQDNILLLSSSRIEERLQEKLIMAQNIKVSKVFPSSIEVFFGERKGVVIWCKDGNNDDCFLIDGDGRAFYQVSRDEDFLNNFPIIFSKGNLEFETDVVIIKPELANFCSEINDSLQEEADIKLERNYYTPSFMSGEIRVKTEQGFVVYFNSFSTAYEQSKLLKSVLVENIKEDVNSLEYIDLRLDGKVLYKLRNSEEAEHDEDNNESD